MKVRAIDEKHDWIFGKGIQGYKVNSLAVKQRIETHLLSFYYDCFFDLEFGVDWKNFWGSKGKEKEIIISCRKQILLIDEVSSCEFLNADLSESRKFTISYKVIDIYGNEISGNVLI